MFYEEEIDRYHSVQFHYEAGTDNQHLKALAAKIWASFSEADQTEIEPKANRKSRLTGLQYVELVVIQLFSHWHTDQTLCLSTPRAKRNRATKDFYNPTGVSTPKLVKVFNALEAYQYVDRINHTKSPDPASKDTTSMIRTSKSLHELFVMTAATELDVDLNKHTKKIELTEWEVGADGEVVKDKNKKKSKRYLPYDESETHIQDKLKVLDDYNDILRKTHIDIANLEEPFVVRLVTDKTGKTSEQKLAINQTKKFVRRVYGRGSFEANGRFYGGFWQSVGEDYRKHITLDGFNTVELDYKSLHPNILRVQQGEEPVTDVYTMGTEPILERFDLEQQRNIMKLLVMIVLNAANEDKAYQGFRQQFVTPKDKPNDPRASITKKEFNLLTTAFANKHPSLENQIAADKGIQLMNTDSQIIEEIIKTFNKLGKPLLTVHDSIIVREQDEVLARTEMTKASASVIGTELKFDEKRMTKGRVDGTRGFNDPEFTKSYQEQLMEGPALTKTVRHKQSLAIFEEWKQSKV